MRGTIIKRRDLHISGIIQYSRYAICYIVISRFQNNPCIIFQCDVTRGILCPHSPENRLFIGKLYLKNHKRSKYIFFWFWLRLLGTAAGTAWNFLRKTIFTVASRPETIQPIVKYFSLPQDLTSIIFSIFIIICKQGLPCPRIFADTAGPVCLFSNYRFRHTPLEANL